MALKHIDYSIVLSCGCSVRARTRPMSPVQTYGCTNGLSHGYSLPWISHTGPDGVPMFNQSKEQQ